MSVLHTHFSQLERKDLMLNEWLETNGLGGYASATVSGALTRSYHGLLIAALRPPVDRMVLLSKLDETLITDSGRFELGANVYDRSVYPFGYKYFTKFEKNIFPTFYYKVDGDILLKKTLASVHGENTTLIVYEVLEAKSSFTLELLPLLAMRSIHSLRRATINHKWGGYFDEDTLRVWEGEPAVQVCITVPGAKFTYKYDWYYNFVYLQEKERGLNYMEDLFSPGTMSVKLEAGDKLGIIVSTDENEGRDALDLLREEQRRRTAEMDRVVHEHPAIKPLILAADQFLVDRGEHGKSIIAGYPWFTDWGRDTMISLPGLCLATGKWQEARQILAEYGKYLDRGMIPNRFPDQGMEPEYNTVDASLWYFIAAYRYLEATGDTKFVLGELMPIFEEILYWHVQGTRYNIREMEDGLLYAGETGVQLTWMDAKAGDWVVTPRIGKPVEINALWYNAWRVYAYLLEKSLQKEKQLLALSKARNIQRVFQQTFWNESANCLYDVITPEGVDAAIRPNQLLAISLPFPLLEKDEANKIIGVVREHLLTPRGLRSLSPRDPAYRDQYNGNQTQRDAAYHQGIIWAWLIGPYIDAVLKFQGDIGLNESRYLVLSLIAHLEEAGIGSMSEIFNAQYPYTPKGCIAQAWSIAEVLRVCWEHGLLGKYQVRHAEKFVPVGEIPLSEIVDTLPQVSTKLYSQIPPSHDIFKSANKRQLRQVGELRIKN